MNYLLSAFLFCTLLVTTPSYAFRLVDSQPMNPVHAFLMKVTDTCEASAEEWRDMAHDLYRVSRLERHKSNPDNGLLLAYSHTGRLEVFVNETSDRYTGTRLTPEQRLTLHDAILLVNEWDVKLNQLLKVQQQSMRTVESNFEVEPALAVARFYVKFADLMGQEDLAEIFPSRRNLYYQKSVLFFYLARTLLAQRMEHKFGNELGINDDVCLVHDRVLTALADIHDATLAEDITDVDRLGYSFLIAKIGFIQVTRPDITTVKQSGKNKGKKKGKKKKGKVVTLSTPKQKIRLREVSDVLFSQAEQLKGMGRHVEAEYRARAAIHIVGRMLRLGFNPNKLALIGKDAKVNIPSLIADSEYGIKALEWADNIDDLVQGTVHIVQPFFSSLIELCGQLHKRSCDHVSELDKFKFYSWVVRAMEEEWQQIPEENRSSQNAIFMGFCKRAAELSLSREQEESFYRKAEAILPVPAEGQSLFDHYKEDLVREREYSSSTMTKRRKAPAVEALIRASRHLDILMALGRGAEAQLLMQEIHDAWEAQAAEARAARRNPTITHTEMLEKIHAEMAAREALEEQLAAQQAAEEEKRARAAGDREAAVDATPYWYHLPTEGVTRPQAQIRKELAARQARLTERAERKAAAKAAKAGSLDDDGAGASDDMVEEAEVETQFTMPDYVRDVLMDKNHGKTFHQLFQQGDDVSITRNAFLSLIVALGGEYREDQGAGSHVFVRLVLGDQTVDMDALEPDLAQQLARSIRKAKSRGTMTLSWPRKGRGHNRRFLSVEQLNNARLVLAANGLVPEALLAE